MRGSFFRIKWTRLNLHYFYILLIVYIGAFLCFPQPVLAFTILLAAGLMNLVDWTTIPWSP